MDELENTMKESARKVFSRRLGLLTASRGDQKKLAISLKIRAQTVSQYVTGRTTPDYDTLRNIASYYSVSIDWLLGLSDQECDAEKATKDSLDAMQRTLSNIRETYGNALLKSLHNLSQELEELEKRGEKGRVQNK